MAANIAAGHAVNNTGVAITFPTDDSVASQLSRLNAAAVTLQNLRGVGVGCPVSSTTFSAQQQALEDGTAPPATAAPPPASASSAAPPPPSSPAAPASTVSSASAPAPTASSPAEGGGADGLTFAQIDALTPQFGFQSDVNPTGTGDCDGAVDDASGQPIKIPCSCPPDRTLFINVNFRSHLNLKQDLIWFLSRICREHCRWTRCQQHGSGLLFPDRQL